MKNVAALTQRELAACFFSPIAYVVGFLFLLGTGLWFIFTTLVPGSEASLRPLFEIMARALVFAIPLLAMRSVSEEYATGTIETLMTAPVTDAQVILGKFLGVLAFYAALVFSTLLYLVLMLMYGRPEPGLVIFGYLGMLLLGALFISVSIFTSTCTRHQLVAAMVAVAVLAIFTILAEYLMNLIPLGLRGAFAAVNVFGHFEDFAKGVFDTKSLIYFLSTTAFFLFLAVKVLESKRWR
jgi:ABC-2 type transport system permease protein